MILENGFQTITANILTDGNVPVILTVEFEVYNDCPPPPPQEEPEFAILVSDSPNRANPRELDGQTVGGNMFVFTSPDDGVEKVSFLIDGIEFNQETVAPFDLAGTVPGEGVDRDAKAFDTLALSNGFHELTVEIETDDGDTIVLEVSFDVNNP